MAASRKPKDAELGCAFDRLPFPLLQSLLSCLDLASLCAASASCRLLRSAVLEVLPYLPSIQLEEISPDKQLLEVFLPCNTALRSLKLDCGLLDDRAIELIAKPHLEELSLQNCGSFSGSFFKEIGLRCSKCVKLSLDLRTINWRGFRYGLRTLLQNCLLLESLSIRGLWSSAEYGLCSELQHLYHLRVLELGYISQAEAVEVLQIGTAPAFGSLQRLSLVLDQISDHLAEAISRNLPWLLELELWDEPREEPRPGRDLTNSGIQTLGFLSKLRRLSIVRSWAVHPTASFKRVNDLGMFLMVEYCRQLESIRLGGFSRITDAACWAILSTCSKLHTFELLSTSQLTDLAFCNVSSTALRLTTINLSSCSLISDDTVKNLAFFSSLQVLNLKGCCNIEDGSLAEICGLEELKVLLLDGSYVSDAGLHILSKSRLPLVSISLRGCSRVTDHGIRALMSGQPGKTLQSVDLSGIPRLTDQGVRAITDKSVPVVDLWLRNCQMLEDESVMALASLHLKQGGSGSLRLLDLWNCRRLSKDCIRQFMRPNFPRIRKLGLTQASSRDLKRLREDRPYLQVHLRGAELGRRRGEGDWMARTGGKYEKQDELERWLEDEDNEEEYVDDKYDQLRPSDEEREEEEWEH